MVFFLTGPSGLIGSYLLKILLKSNHKVYALARKHEGIQSRERLFKILNFWDKDILKSKYSSLVVLEGVITKHGLGLNRDTRESISEQIDQIFHCAAATRFNSDPEELKKVNIEGSRMVFDLGLECVKKGKLKKVNYLSSVYVCGDHEGVFRESDLEVNQKFNTPYQASKFEAEVLVNKYRKVGLWIDVFRPPAVGGELKTGKILLFNQALYQALHLLNLDLFEFLPIGAKQKFHMVCVDELCRSIFIISSMSLERNKNYHNFNNQGIPLRKTLSIFSKYLGINKTKFIRNDEFIKNKSTPLQRRIIQFNFFFLNSNVKLNAIETNKFLNNNGFNFSALNEELLLKLLNYSIKRGFLKKR